MYLSQHPLGCVNFWMLCTAAVLLTLSSSAVIGASATLFNSWTDALSQSPVVPRARAFQSMIPYGVDGAIVYGGQNVESATVFSSVYLLNRTTLMWTEQITQGLKPSNGVFGHRAVNLFVPDSANSTVSGKSYMVVFGGVVALADSIEIDGSNPLQPSNETWIYGPLNGSLRDATWYKPPLLNWPTAGENSPFPRFIIQDT